MKNYFILIPCILLLSCCAKQQGREIQIVPTVGISPTEDDKTKPLMIGGKQYYTRNSLEPSKNKALTLGDINDIQILVLDIDPLDSSKMNSLKGIEQLFNAQNIEQIRINGKNLNGVDLSLLEQFSNITNFSIIVNGSSRVLPDLSALKTLRELSIWDVIFEQPYTLNVPLSLTGLNLEGTNLFNVDLSVVETLCDLSGIRIAGNITRLPDLTGLENLRSIRIEGSQLESLVGIGAPNINTIEVGNGKEIDSLAPLNNLLYLEYLTISLPREKEYKIVDIVNLPSLKTLVLYIGKIDLQGIENLSALEKLWLNYCEPFNIEGIGRLTNLKELLLNLTSPAPSLEFLQGMPNLFNLYLEADIWANGIRRGAPGEPEAYQVLDLSPIATLKNLQNLTCRNFIIKNISALDILDALSIGSPGFINLVGSRLYDSTEKSRHRLVFELYRD